MRRSVGAWIVGCVLLLWLTPWPATAADVTPRNVAVKAAEQGARIAVVLGNANYPSGILANPRNDATAVAAAFRRLGFDVELMLDASKTDMDALFRRLGARAERAGVAAFYYAGHGIQVNGSNFLVPLDANPRSERDLKRDVIRLDDVIDDMGPAKIKLVFFDACRDNPLARSFSRGASRGLAPPVEASGTLISFATKHGNTALDGDGKHSPYTSALLSALEQPRGVEIEQLLRKVQQGVRQATQGQQEPWRYGSLDGDFFFVAGDSPEDVARAQKEATDRAVTAAVTVAVSEAVRQANAQAAREKAELLEAMEKKLKEALAKQNAALQAEREAWLAANASAMRLALANKPPSVAVAPAAIAAAPAPGPAAAPAEAPKPNPTTTAAVAPSPAAPASPAPATPPASALAALATAGDEWEYLAKDIYGRKEKLITRVKGAVSGIGLLEEFVVGGKPPAEWVLDGKPRLVGLPMEAIFLFAPNWNGESEDIDLLNSAACLAIQHATGCAAAWMRVAGRERISVPAGSFETRKLEIRVLGSSNWGAATLDVTVWYSPDLKRTVRQSIRGRHPIAEASVNQLNETIELVAVRRAPQ